MSEDYTGRLIKDTYQNVLHKGADGKIYDGVGNEYAISITASMDSASYAESSSYSFSSSYIDFNNVDNVPDFVLESETSSIFVLSSSYSEFAESVEWTSVLNRPTVIISSSQQFTSADNVEFGNITGSNLVVNGDTNVSGTFKVNGPFYTFQTKRISSNYTASVGEFLLCDTTSSFNILLPNSSDDSQIGIKKLYTSSLATIYTEGVNEVDENPTPLILAGKSSVTLICNSNTWYII